MYDLCTSTAILSNFDSMSFGILFSFKVPGLFWEFVEFLPCRFRGKITTKVIGDKSISLNNCSLFDINLFLGWLTSRDLIDMWFNQGLIKISIIFSLLSFKHVTKKLSEPNFHLELKD